MRGGAKGTRESLAIPRFKIGGIKNNKIFEEFLGSIFSQIAFYLLYLQYSISY
jgi:hypothetical protein